MSVEEQSKDARGVVIIGGGFGGLYAAKALSRLGVHIALVDKRNFHLFQPLLYQVASGSLSPGDIASPLRAVLARYPEAHVIRGEVIDINPAEKFVLLKDKAKIFYDSLIVASGSCDHYFGHNEWGRVAPGLKTVEDALRIRARIFSAFERAEREEQSDERQALLTFVLIGAGPTGVEMAGTLAELAHYTLANEFRHFDPKQSRILLIEAGERVLATYPERLSRKAAATLERLGVTLLTRSRVVEIREDAVIVAREDGSREVIRAETILWSAGVTASPLGQVLAQQAGARLNAAGRVHVQSDLTLAAHPEIFVIGDLACVADGCDGTCLPGTAPVAMQQGDYVAKAIHQRSLGQDVAPFLFHDKGSLAVIGRNAAVAVIRKWQFSGFFAWFLWAFVHIRYLIGFDNKMLVLFQWASNYFTRKRGARLITKGKG